MSSLNCMATIGQVGNLDHENVQIGKAGRKRHMGWRPTVRGSVHEPLRPPPRRRLRARALWAVPAPVTPGASPPWVTRPAKTKNPTDKFIVKRRNAK